MRLGLIWWIFQVYKHHNYVYKQWLQRMRLVALYFFFCPLKLDKHMYFSCILNWAVQLMSCNFRVSFLICILERVVNINMVLGILLSFMRCKSFADVCTNNSSKDDVMHRKSPIERDFHVIWTAKSLKTHKTYFLLPTFLNKSLKYERKLISKAFLMLEKHYN